MKPADIKTYLASVTTPEALMMRLYSGGQPRVIFDVGSCEGEDTIRYSRRFPNARVYAFEALPSNQTLITENFRLFSTVNTVLVPCALSDREGQATFHVSSGRPGDEFAGKDWNYGNKSSSLLAPATGDPMHGWVEFKESITVPTKTLDSFCSQNGIGRIDFLHMDVQGAERLVLEGSRRMLPSIGAIWLEVSDKALYEGQALRPEIERLMRENGFHLGHEVMNKVEGDQLYLNGRQLRTWRYLASNRARAALRAARFQMGRVRSTLFGKKDSR